MELKNLDIFRFLASEIILQATHETPRVLNLRNAIEERTSHLADLISIDLANPVNNKGAVQANIDMLLRLKLGDQVRVGGGVGVMVMQDDEFFCECELIEWVFGDTST